MGGTGATTIQNYNEGVASEKSWYPEMHLATHPMIILSRIGFSQFLPFSQKLWAQVGFTGHFLKLRNAALVFVDPAAAGSQHFLELHLHPKTQRIDDAAASGDAGGDGTAGGGL